MQSDRPGNQDWTVRPANISASCVSKWLPGGISSLATRSGIYSEIMELPFDPRAYVQQEPVLFFF